MGNVDEHTIGALGHHASEAILAHPRFAEARKAYVEVMLGLYEHDRFMNRLLVEAARSVVFFNLVCLHFAHDDDDRATWPTMSLLQQTVSQFGMASTRRVEDLVARFVRSGYVVAAPVVKDRRVRILTPTAKALAHDRDWLAAYYTPLEVLFPDPGYGPALRRDPSFQRAQRVIGLGMRSYAARLMSSNPAVMLFMGRDAGMMILMKLVQLAEDRGGVSSGRISFADLGTRFGISRTHVRETLRDAERAGLVQMSEQGVLLETPLIAAFDRFFADTLAGSDLMFRAAMAQVDAMATA